MTIYSKQTKLQTKNILIDEKNYADLVNYFTRYNHRKQIRMLILYYHELIGKIEEHEGKNTSWMMIIYYIKYQARLEE